MRKWLLLLVGILLISVLAHLCFRTKANYIKQDLVGKVESLYKDRGISNVDVNLIGDGLQLTRDIRLEGSVATKDLKEEAQKLALEVNGVRSVDNRIKIISNKKVEHSIKKEVANLTPSAYTISAIKDKSKKVVLSGYVSDTLEHVVVVDKAQSLFGKEVVIDKLKEVKGAPKSWKESTLLGLERLAEVDYGEFNITNNNFKFSGYVQTDKLKLGVIEKLKSNLNSNYKGDYKVISLNKDLKIRTPKTSIPKPYTFSAIKGKDSKVILSGYVVAPLEHKQIISKAQNLFDKESIEDRLKEIKGAPKFWRESILLGLDNLAKVEYGEFNITNNNFKFSGYAKTDKLKSDVIENLNRDLDSNYKGYYDVKAPKIDKKVLCQREFKKLLSSQKIKFKYDKAVIKRDSFTLLNKLVDIANMCPKTKIIIEGHTDSDGSREYNYKLSRKRASSVKAYLIKKGIDKKRLKAVGYGESKPIATNKTEKGKERNRRIEFKIEGVK